MNSSGQAQTAQTAQNILSEEKSFKAVQFAITGQRESDTLAGIIAVLNTTGLNTHSLRGTQRIFEYVAVLYKDSADQSDRVTESWKTQGVFSGGSLGQGINQPNLGQYSGLQGQAIGSSNLGQIASVLPMPTASEVEDLKKLMAIKTQMEQCQRENQKPLPDAIWKTQP